MSTQSNTVPPTEAGGKAKYRVKNWPEYDQALVKRGNITVWFEPDTPHGIHQKQFAEPFALITDINNQPA